MEETEIKIDLSLEEELARLKTAISEFEPYSKNFIDNTVKSLEPMNSDFVESITDTLNNMTDTKAPELIKKLGNLSTALEGVVTTFKALDEDGAAKLQQGEIMQVPKIY